MRKPSKPGYPGEILTYGGKLWTWDANLDDWVPYLAIGLTADGDLAPIIIPRDAEAPSAKPEADEAPDAH